MSKYIDADKLKEFYKPYAERKLSVPVDVILLNIDDMPTEDVQEVRHRRWERCDFPASSGEYTMYQCSVCACLYYEPSHYCPYCGAKMDEVEEWANT